MISATRLLDGRVGGEVEPRCGRTPPDTPAQFLHVTRERKPVVAWNRTDSELAT